MIFLERLNPFWKALCVALCAVLLSFSYSVTLNSVVFFGCLATLFFCSHVRKGRVLKLLFPVLLLAVSLLFTGVLFSKGGAAGVSGAIGVAAIRIGSFYNGLQLATRVFAFAGLGLLFSLTTNAQEFIGSLLHQAHLPPKFAYGILAAVNLAPNIRREYADARAALSARGAHVTAFSVKPLFLMLVHSIRWSEALAMAMESKGFCSEAPRTAYHIPTVKWYDFVFFVCTTGLLLAGVLFLHD